MKKILEKLAKGKKLSHEERQNVMNLLFNDLRSDLELHVNNNTIFAEAQLLLLKSMGADFLAIDNKTKANLMMDEAEKAFEDYEIKKVTEEILKNKELLVPEYYQSYLMNSNHVLIRPVVMFQKQKHMLHLHRVIINMNITKNFKVVFNDDLTISIYKKYEENTMFNLTWKREAIQDVELPVLNMNHTYKKRKGIKFTKGKQEIIVILELAPEDGGHVEEWIIAEKKGDKYECSWQTSDKYTTQYLKEKFGIKNSSYNELFKTNL